MLRATRDVTTKNPRQAVLHHERPLDTLPAATNMPACCDTSSAQTACSALPQGRQWHCCNAARPTVMQDGNVKSFMQARPAAAGAQGAGPNTFAHGTARPHHEQARKQPYMLEHGPCKFIPVCSVSSVLAHNTAATRVRRGAGRPRQKTHTHASCCDGCQQHGQQQQGAAPPQHSCRR